MTSSTRTDEEDTFFLVTLHLGDDSTIFLKLSLESRWKRKDLCVGTFVRRQTKASSQNQKGLPDFYKFLMGNSGFE